MDDDEDQPTTTPAGGAHGRSAGDALAEEARLERARVRLGIHPGDSRAIVRPTEVQEPPPDPDPGDPAEGR